MKKVTGRILAFLLLAATAGIVSSCGDTPVESTQAKETVAPTNPEEVVTEVVDGKLHDSLPEGLDFGGYTIRVITSDDVSFDIAGDSVDIVDVAVYQRNMSVMERLNVNFNYVVEFENQAIASRFKNSVIAGADDYDFYAGYCYWSISLATSGGLLNLANEQYLDLSQEYWGKKFIDAMAYKDYIYWLTGDIVLSYTSGMYATYVNLEQWNNYYDESVYDVVREGKWTIENLTARSKEVYRDLNGDSKIDEGDFLGFVYTQEDAIDGLSISCGVRYTEFNEQGVPELTICANPDKAVTFADQLYELCQGSGSLMLKADGGYITFQTFAQGNVMFNIGRLKLATLYLRDMKADFAIIPMPKGDEAQENYLTTLHDGTTIIGLPKTITDDGRAATTAALEAMACESYNSLTPVFLDDALKYKYSRDASSAEMIDLIRSNIVSDFGFQYTATGFNNLYRTFTNRNGSTLASTFAKRETKWQNTLDKIVTALENNAD